MKQKIVENLFENFRKSMQLAYKNQQRVKIPIKNKKNQKIKVQNGSIDKSIPLAHTTKLIANSKRKINYIKQINQIIKHASTKFPHTNIFSIVQNLYFKLQQMKQQELRNKITPQQLPSKYFDFHNFLKKMIARSYYFYGFGYEKFLNYMLKKHASFHIDEEMYIIFSKGMVLQTYRSLERILIRDGHIIKLKHKNLVMKLNEWILSKSQSPLQGDTQLFRRFMAKKYQINDSHFSSKNAKKLYDILEEKFDPFATKDVEKMDQCLNSIEIHSNDSQELNFDNLLQENYRIGQQINLNLNFNENVPNPINTIQTQDGLNYQGYNIDELNFDVVSTDNIHF